MMPAIMNSAMLDSAILVFPLKLTHTCKDWFPPFPQKKLHSHFPPRHLHKKPSLIHSDSTWWRQPSWILPCWIKKLHSFILTQLDDGSHLEFYHVKFRHCHLGFRHLLIFSQIHSKTLSLHSDSWLKLIYSHSILFILTQLDDGSHLEFFHPGFSHLSFSSQTHSHFPGLVPTCAQKRLHSHFPLHHLHKKTSLIHSDSTWWWQPSWILPCWIKKLHSFILTQLDDGSHLEFCHVGFRLPVFFSRIHSKTLSLHSDSWLKLI